MIYSGGQHCCIQAKTRVFDKRTFYKVDTDESDRFCELSLENKAMTKKPNKRLFITAS